MERKVSVDVELWKVVPIETVSIQVVVVHSKALSRAAFTVAIVSGPGMGLSEEAFNHAIREKYSTFFAGFRALLHALVYRAATHTQHLSLDLWLAVNATHLSLHAFTRLKCTEMVSRTSLLRLWVIALTSSQRRCRGKDSVASFVWRSSTRYVKRTRFFETPLNA